MPMSRSERARERVDGRKERKKGRKRRVEQWQAQEETYSGMRMARSS
jgi:hypothetical protein